MGARTLMARLLQFLPALPNLSLNAIIDMLIVAFLVYQALMVVRGTRAGHILLGILMMVSLYAIAVWAGLEALRSVLSFIVPYLGLAIIFLFQSEIRRTLARIGRKSWVGAGFRAPESIHEIALAVEQLAEKKTGALIILERDIGLRTFVESGVVLEARISRDLLLSIFQPGLPLHDGAAIGIPEETACISVVVSEETGRISVAAFGELVSGISVAELLDRINQHLGLQRALGHVDHSEFAHGVHSSAAEEQRR